MHVCMCVWCVCVMCVCVHCRKEEIIILTYTIHPVVRVEGERRGASVSCIIAA